MFVDFNTSCCLYFMLLNTFCEGIRRFHSDGSMAQTRWRIPFIDWARTYAHITPVVHKSWASSRAGSYMCFTVTPNISRSLVWQSLHVIILAPRILKWLLHLWNLCIPLHYTSFRYAFASLIFVHPPASDQNTKPHPVKPSCSSWLLCSPQTLQKQRTLSS